MRVSLEVRYVGSQLPNQTVEHSPPHGTNTNFLFLSQASRISNENVVDWPLKMIHMDDRVQLSVLPSRAFTDDSTCGHVEVQEWARRCCTILSSWYCAIDLTCVCAAIERVQILDPSRAVSTSFWSSPVWIWTYGLHNGRVRGLLADTTKWDLCNSYDRWKLIIFLTKNWKTRVLFMEHNMGEFHFNIPVFGLWMRNA